MPTFNLKIHRIKAQNIVYILISFVIVFQLFRLFTISSRFGPKLFKRPPGTGHLQCNWVYDGQHQSYVSSLARNRTTYFDPPNDEDLPTDCASIKRRHHWTSRPLSQEEADFPIAIARTIYNDYFYQEMTLAAIYQPQNHYCLAIDVDVSEVNRKRFYNLASCFPNIVIPPVEREMTSSGYNIDLANLDCLRALAKKEKEWKYVAVLHNYDLILKTNAEIVQIYKWFNGSNDISMTNGGPHKVDKNVTWTVNSVKLFKKDSKYCEQFERNDVPIRFVQAYNKNKMSLTREAVDFILDEMNIDHFVNLINKKWVIATDEVVFPTLLSMPELMIPGHFTQECIAPLKMNPYVTNHATFLNPKHCYSNRFEHNVCLFGIEDLRDHVHNLKYISIKKIVPWFDFNAVVCQVEAEYNKTHGLSPHPPLNPAEYKELQHVRYHNWRAQSNFDTTGKTFVC